MTKSHKRRSHSTMGTQKKYTEVHDVTYHALGEWFRAKFEKLGWMILAKKHGYLDKISEYQTSVKRLHAAICKKISKMHDKDKKTDLYIMKENVETLLEHIQKDFD